MSEKEKNKDAYFRYFKTVECIIKKPLRGHSKGSKLYNTREFTVEKKARKINVLFHNHLTQLVLASHSIGIWIQPISLEG